MLPGEQQTNPGRCMSACAVSRGDADAGEPAARVAEDAMMTQVSTTQRRDARGDPAVEC
ncbi:MAG: hypothetical protein WKF73_20580 [Nocardioidaceae bacterium]